MSVYWIRFFFFVSLFISKFLKFIVYSLNFVLCLHIAINSLLLFNNFSGNLYVIICIYSSKHKLHLPSKLFGVFDFFKIGHSISGVKTLFFKHLNCFGSALWYFSGSQTDISFFICNILFGVNYCLIYYII